LTPRQNLPQQLEDAQLAVKNAIGLCPELTSLQCVENRIVRMIPQGATEAVG
jgi:hypothetical protein